MAVLAVLFTGFFAASRLRMTEGIKKKVIPWARARGITKQNVGLHNIIQTYPPKPVSGSKGQALKRRVTAERYSSRLRDLFRALYSLALPGNIQII